MKQGKYIEKGKGTTELAYRTVHIDGTLRGLALDRLHLFDFFQQSSAVGWPIYIVHTDASKSNLSFILGQWKTRPIEQDPILSTYIKLLGFGSKFEDAFAIHRLSNDIFNNTIILLKRARRRVPWLVRG